MPGFNPFNIESMTANKGVDFVSRDKQSMAIKQKPAEKRTIAKPNGQKKIKK